MRQFVIATILAVAAFGVVPAHAQTTQNQQEIPNMGRAPREADGVGRLDLRVVDQDGNPVQGVRADLKSKRSNGFECESWNWTNAQGVAVLPPLHMGRLQLTLKAKGFETLKLNVNAADLDQPLRVTMIRKS
jgi:hypothetical protein